MLFFSFAYFFRHLVRRLGKGSNGLFGRRRDLVDRRFSLGEKKSFLSRCSLWERCNAGPGFHYHRPSSIEVRVTLLREKEMSRLKSDMLSQIGHLNLAVTSNLDLEDVEKSLSDTIELFFPEWSTMLASIFTMLLEYSFRLESPQNFTDQKVKVVLNTITGCGGSEPVRKAAKTFWGREVLNRTVKYRNCARCK